MTTFDEAMEFVFQWEGGYVENDPGGETNWGISKKAYPEIDIKALTKDEAKKIYRSDYWDKCRCDEMPWGIALVVFDEAVNQGVRAASLDLQRAIGVYDDGIIGPVIMKALGDAQEKMTVDELVEKVMTERMWRYWTTLAGSSRMWKFGKGWMHRAIACMRIAMEEA